MLDILPRLFGLVVLLKGLDIVLRGPSHLGHAEIVTISTLWFAAGVMMSIAAVVPIAAGAVVALSAAIAYLSRFELYNQHLYLIASIATILVIGYQIVTLLRIQLSIVYFFAAITKVNESFLSGSTLYESAVTKPMWSALFQEPSANVLILMSVAGIFVEMFLAFGFWFRRSKRIALGSGIGLHLTMVVFLSHNLPNFIQLVVFGLLMVILYLSYFDHDAETVLTRRLISRTANGMG